MCWNCEKYLQRRKFQKAALRWKVKERKKVLGPGVMVSKSK